MVAVKPGLGVFLDLGISKDVLLSKDDLPVDESLWPQVDDQVYVDLRVKARLTARPIPYNEIRLITGNLNVGDEVSGFVVIVDFTFTFLSLYNKPNARLNDFLLSPKTF